jgi:hypothetical protein
MFDGVPWQGVPLGTYDFGGSIGVQNVGNTDTIIQRSGTVNAPGGTMALDVVALQVQTVNQVSLGGGPVGYYYATLDTSVPNQNSGQLTIDSFPTAGSPGTFNDYFTVYFDIRYGSLTGPIVAEQNLVLDASGDWQTTLPVPSTPIPHISTGVGSDTHSVTGDPTFSQDVGLIDPGYPSDGDELFYPFGVPEPSSLALLGLGAVSLLAREWRRRTAKA